MGRREEREEAFSLLFANEFQKESIESQIATTLEDREEPFAEFTSELANGAWEHLSDIDEIISKNSDNWNKNRISKAALAILRIAVYEIYFYESTPPAVAINEAVELAKKFGSDADGSFVNGILGAALKAKE